MKISEVKTEQNQAGHSDWQKQKRGCRQTISQNHFQTTTQERAKLLKPTGRTAMQSLGCGKIASGRLECSAGLRRSQRLRQIAPSLPLGPFFCPVFGRLIFDRQIHVRQSVDFKMLKCSHPRAEPEHASVTEDHDFVGAIDVVEMVRDAEYRHARPRAIG